MRAEPHTIAFVLPNFNAGGAERVMVTIANHLNRARFQPIFIVFHDQGPLRASLAPDIRVMNLNAQNIGQAIKSLPWAVKDAGAALVISTMVHVNIAVLCAHFKMPHMPVIVREAITPRYFKNHLFKRFVLWCGYHFLYPRAQKVLSPTRMVFDEMPARLREKTALLQRIFNPVDVDAMMPDVDVSLRTQYAQDHQRLFVAAGRLVPQKGFDLLINALAAWRSRDDWRLVILGEGPQHDELQKLIDMHGLHQITLAGFEKAPWRYYAVADAFLLPSRYEGLPNVVLEALAMGAPMIASSTAGGIAEIAQEASTQDVMIAQNMDEFLARMDAVVIQSGQRVNRLPNCFLLPHIVREYEECFARVIESAEQKGARAS